MPPSRHAHLLFNFDTRGVSHLAYTGSIIDAYRTPYLGISITSSRDAYKLLSYATAAARCLLMALVAAFVYLVSYHCFYLRFLLQPTGIGILTIDFWEPLGLISSYFLPAHAQKKYPANFLIIHSA